MTDCQRLLGALTVLLAAWLLPAAAMAQDHCSGLDYDTCLSRAGCTTVDGVCALATDACAATWAATDAADLCDEIESCGYVPPGPCYCPPSEECECTGGSPPACATLE